MALNNNNVTLFSFNCRSVRSSVPEINELCEHCDFLLVQEHWLLPNETNFLSNLHKEFLAVGHSSVDISQGILTGRPYGGTGILFRKTLSKFISILDTHNPRVTALILKTVCGPTLLVSTYMPTDCGDNDSLETYIETCAYITALYRDVDAVQLIVGGDFNCRVGSRFFDLFLRFVNDNNLQLTDLNRLQDVFTFCNDAGNASSWIDHFVCSLAVDNLVSNCAVHYEYITSDHKPISVTLNHLLPFHDVSAVNNSVANCKVLPDWSSCDENCIE